MWPDSAEVEVTWVAGDEGDNMAELQLWWDHTSPPPCSFLSLLLGPVPWASPPALEQR